MRARGFAWFFFLSVAAAGTVWGCGEDGVTPASCPPLPLYDVKDGGTEDGGRVDPNEEAEIQAAVNANCLSPVGTALSENTPDPNANNGGAGG